MKNSIKLRKIIAIISISCVSLAAIIGILLLFKVITFSEIIGKILLTLLTFFLGSLLSLNSVDAIRRKNIIGYISEGLLLLSILLVLVLIFVTNEKTISTLRTITTIVASFSAWFSIFVANIMKLGKKLLIIQVIEYLGLATLFITLDIFLLSNKLLIEGTILIAVGIVTLVLSIVLSIKAKLSQDEKSLITITVEEYNKLLNRIKELEDKLGE